MEHFIFFKICVRGKSTIYFTGFVNLSNVAYYILMNGFRHISNCANCESFRCRRQSFACAKTKFYFHSCGIFYRFSYIKFLGPGLVYGWFESYLICFFALLLLLSPLNNNSMILFYCVFFLYNRAGWIIINM